MSFNDEIDQYTRKVSKTIDINGNSTTLNLIRFDNKSIINVVNNWITCLPSNMLSGTFLRETTVTFLSSTAPSSRIGKHPTFSPLNFT